MTDEQPLHTSHVGNVLVARLDRSDARNALTPALINAIGGAVVAAETDDAVRAIVLTGSGERAFCAGMDLRAFASGVEFTLDDATSDAFMRLLDGRARVPVVGAANGAAVAGGFELMLACDVIVAAEHATFALPEVKRGLIPAGGGIFLGTRVPLGVALEITLTGDAISAARAYELGLVNAVVAATDLLPRALDLAERIAGNGPLAVAAIKELVRLGVDDAARARERMRELQPEVFASEDAQEGARAFVEKRAPVWRGR
ncbi:MAG TPA: enoyl-CoA hydratase-related protein [Acidimicrobiia bacterium]|jgi:enoyl-CoA hydratase/carnithine racemase